jgi:hypothetical protein
VHVRVIVQKWSRMLALALAGCLMAASANAQYRGDGAGGRRPPRPRTLAIGVAASVASSTDNVCTQGGDVVSCTMALFFGGDIAAHYFLLDMIAVGGRFAGSTDSGADPEYEQWMWRGTASARFYPPFLRSLFVGGELGFALLHEAASPASISTEESADRATLLLGIGAGFDLRLGEHWVLAPEARLQRLDFGDPHEYEANVEGYAYDSSTWVEAAVRLTYEL